MTDLQLIDDLKNRDEDAFRKLLSLYGDKVFHICIGLVHNTTDAEDLTQDVFIEVFDSIGSFRGNSQLYTWIYRIAVNKSLNFVKKKVIRRRIQQIGDLFKASNDGAIEARDNTSPQSTLEDNELKRIIHKAIEMLPENQRIAFTLQQYNDLSYREIAEVTGSTESAVDSLIVRAKQNLQKRLIQLKK